MRWFRDYALGWAYLAGWLLFWGLHAVFTYWVDLYDPYMAPWQLGWLETSFENLASEYHQVGVLILLTKFLVFRGSPESKDSDEDMERRITAHVDSAVRGLRAELRAARDINRMGGA